MRRCPCAQASASSLTRAYCLQSYPGLAAVFSRFGPLHEVQLPPPRQPDGAAQFGFSDPEARVFAFVQFYSEYDCRNALEACSLRQVSLGRHVLSVTPVQRRTVRSAPGLSATRNS